MLARIVFLAAILNATDKAPGTPVDRRPLPAEAEASTILKGSEDVSVSPPPRSGRKPLGPAIEVRFPEHLDLNRARALLAESERKGSDPLYQAALAWAELVAEKGGAKASKASCERIPANGCVWWCCSDPATGREACRISWCDAR